MERAEPLPHNPEIERRARTEVEATKALSLRAEHVLAAYFVAHPKHELRKMVEEGLISPERAYKTLLEQARDPKTGVQRMDILPHVLDYEMYVRREKGDPFTVGFYDIDDFKRVNSDYDHTVGDEVLHQGAAVMTQSVRKFDDAMAQAPQDTAPGDAITRYGGEEFLVIYTNTDKQQALIPAERLRSDFEEQMAGALPDQRRMTISGGLVEYDPERHKSWQDLLQEGSQLVLAAKAAGKNRVLTDRPEVEAA